jgi:predicted HicB family RNase H-like nuclease
VSNVFEYRGYIGSVELDVESMVLVGKLLFIRDTITYSAKTPPELESAFKEAVDDYLATCAELGDEPDVPCKGTFNVRLGPALHRDVALAARKRDLGLNEFMVYAAKLALSDDPSRKAAHVQVVGTVAKHVASTGQRKMKWEETVSVTAH